MAEYAVVEFDDGVQLIPNNWLCDDNRMSYWPPLTSQLKVNRAVEIQMEPTKDWPKHKLLRIFCHADNYQKGIEKAKLAETISDVDTDVELKRTRHVRHKKTLEEVSDIDSDLDEDILPPPKKRLMSAAVKTQNANTDECMSSTSSSTVTLSGESTPTNRRTPESSLHLGLDLDFRKEILRKLNTLIYKVESLEEKFLPANKPNKDGNALNFEEHRNLFPITNEEDLTAFENRLTKENGFFKVMVNTFRSIGGTDTHSLTVNILKRLFSNSIVVHYSLIGKKKKKSFRNLLSYSLVVQTVREHQPQTTENEIAGIIATWLAQATLRLSREQDKKKKDTGTDKN